MKYLAIFSLTFLLGFTTAKSGFVGNVQTIEGKIKSIKEINDIDAVDLEIQILNINDDLLEWQNEMIELLQSKTVLSEIKNK